MNRVAFRVDSSALMGTGHVVRCLTLANELRRYGASATFICREHDGNLISRIENDGHVVVRLPKPVKPIRSDIAEDYAVWLGVPQELDAQETLDCLTSRRHDWLVVDHYGLDAAWERRLRPAVGSMMCIDDLANREHACDLLLDQNYFGAASQDRYLGRTPDTCTLLLGPTYALLRPEYRQMRALLPERDGVIKRVLIFFGGSDLRNDTMRVLQALSCEELGDLAVDVVVGANHKERHQIDAWAAGRRGATVYSGLASLAGLLARADLAIGGGGGTTWERACLRVPSVVATIADNQKVYSRLLAEEGYHVLLGDSASVTVAAWRAALVSFLGDSTRMAGVAARAASLTDGWGAGRVANAMLGSAADVVLRKDAGGTLRLVEDRFGVPLGHLHMEPAADELVTVVEASGVLGGAALQRRAIRSLIRSRADGPGYLTGPTRSSRALRITVLSDASSWLNESILGWLQEWLEKGNQVRWVHDATNLCTGDVCFVIGCSQLLSSAARAQNAHTLVVHESALPQGRGWSPMTWQILEDLRSIVVTLFEAAEKVDAGRIHLQTTIELNGGELVEEWRSLQAQATRDLCMRWLEQYPQSAQAARDQAGTSSFYPRRRPADSKLDPERTIAEQFDLLRVVDNARYPAYFQYRGRHYRLLITTAEVAHPCVSDNQRGTPRHDS